MSTFTSDALRELNTMFLENMSLWVVVDNMATEWAVILEDCEVIGIYTTEAEAVQGLARFDQRQPDTPAWIVSRYVGPWVKSPV